MKYYDLNSELNFGKFEGKTIREILDLQPSYIDWCSINLDHFFISNTVIEDIKTIIPDFAISREGQEKLDKKYLTLNSQESSNNNDYENYGDQTDWTHYNDDLDMDQQGIDFWNQF